MEQAIWCVSLPRSINPANVELNVEIFIDLGMNRYRLHRTIHEKN